MFIQNKSGIRVKLNYSNNPNNTFYNIQMRSVGSSMGPNPSTEMNASYDGVWSIKLNWAQWPQRDASCGQGGVLIDRLIYTMYSKSSEYDLHEMRRTALISFGETSQVDLTHSDCFN